MPIDKIRLVPYRSSRAGQRFRPLLMLLVGAFSCITGAAIVILPPQLLFIPAIPILLSVAAMLWLLPDSKKIADPRLLGSLVPLFLVFNCVWPNYIALNLPGLPWINPARAITFSMLAIGVYQFAVSGSLRTELRETTRSLPITRIAFWTFWWCTFISVFMSGGSGFSITRWVNNQIYWTFFFLLAAWMATKTDVISKSARVIVWSAILIALDGIYEYSTRKVPWADHIPQWLVSDPAMVANILALHARAGTDVYRATGTFNVSLVFAEYLSLAYPFLLHAMFTARQLWRKALLGAGLCALASAMWMTNARSGMIGFFMSVFLYTGLSAYKNWKTKRGSLIGVSSIAALPIGAMIFVVLMLTWPRLHNMTIGGGQHQASTEGREAQWAMGVPKIMRNPIGAGPGQSGGALGYTNLGGDVTVDSYYLTLLMEYGVVGFLAFMVMLLSVFVPGISLFIGAKDNEEANYSGPITVALVNLIVIKAVLSSEFNLPVAFIFIGFLIGLTRLAQIKVVPAAVQGVNVGSRQVKVRGGLAVT